MKKHTGQTKNNAWICFFGVLMLLTLLAPSLSYAVTSACDPDYYKSLESRAWMEAQREIEQNQNLIVKPDSVLEYTCFDKFGSELAEHAINMFSETTRWGTILPATSMDNALSSLVGDSLVAYQNSNFSHKSLGGRGITKHKFTANISGGAYACDQMDKIWQKTDKTAKCYNFQTESHDNFFTFKQHESEIVRKLPQACVSDERWAKQNKKALGKYMGYADTDTPWQEDREFKFLDITKACTESPIVKTGIKITSKDESYDEGICLIPGCAYTGASACVEGVPPSATGPH